MQKSNQLVVKSLTKTYAQKSVFGKTKQTVNALKDVSFSLSPGLYGLLGPNGAGKSTLINIVVGILRQDSGLVLWNGKLTHEMGIGFRRILGFMPQQQKLYDNYTGRRFLSYICVLKEIDGTNVAPEVERVANIVHLTEELDKKLSAYSGGMKQRLLAASAMIPAPLITISFITFFQTLFAQYAAIYVFLNFTSGPLRSRTSSVKALSLTTFRLYILLA